MMHFKKGIFGKLYLSKYTSTTHPAAKKKKKSS